MSRVTPLERSELGEFEPFFKIVEQLMGFVPNSMLTMGKRPEILRGFTAPSGAVLGPGQIPADLKQLIAFEYDTSTLFTAAERAALRLANDTLATQLEAEPVEFASENLSARGWQPGAHGT